MSNEQETYSVSVFRGVINNNTNLQPGSSPEFNETIHFNGDTQTYRELVYTSRIRETLNLPIEVLTSDSTTSRIAVRNKKKGTKVIPRPQNAWIIYRRNKYAGPEFVGIKSSIASSIIGICWQNEDNEVLEYFIALSMLALENHQKKYGDYKYQPKQRIRISRKLKKHQSLIKENIENTSSETKIPTDLLQFTNEYPTPASSITHSPVVTQDNSSEQTNNNSYLITPASSNQNSPSTFQDDYLEQMNDPTNQYSFITLSMCPDLSTIIPIIPADGVSAFSAYSENNNISELFRDAALLTTLQPSPNTITTNTGASIQDFNLYSENEPFMYNIIPPVEATQINNPYPENEIPMSNIISPTVDVNTEELFNLLEDDPFSMTPFMDQLDYNDSNGLPFSQ